mmetsp:Transcript_47739/g.119289  ORF Transcript_47739/g.119289 Transcript_47739/m.119289 type:complete len:218 (-) Transcript_47739:351-1004(-)
MRMLSVVLFLAMTSAMHVLITLHALRFLWMLTRCRNRHECLRMKALSVHLRLNCRRHRSALMLRWITSTAACLCRFTSLSTLPLTIALPHAAIRADAAHVGKSTHCLPRRRSRSCCLSLAAFIASLFSSLRRSASFRSALSCSTCSLLLARCCRSRTACCAVRSRIRSISFQYWYSPWSAFVMLLRMWSTPPLLSISTLFRSASASFSCSLRAASRR